MAAAVQLVLQTDLSTSRSVVPVLANDDSGAYLTSAKDVVHATVTQRNGRISLNVAITSSSTQKNWQIVDLNGVSSSGILPLLNQLAKQIDNGASSFSTKSDRALQAYVTAVSSQTAQQRIAGLTDAVSIDPSFGLAYIALADAQGQAAPQALPSLLQSASSHSGGFSPLDRVRFNAYLARYSHVPLAKEEAAFRAILQIAPNEPDALIAAGSLSFLRGDAQDGSRYLQHALELNPGNLNIRKALADGLFETSRFAEAEKLLVGMDNNAAVLPELAVCVLLEGDVARANVIAERLFASIPNPDAKTLYRAVWLKLSGQSQQAVPLLAGTNFSQPATQAIAYSELSIWEMAANNFNAAKWWAAKAHELDARPSSISSVVVLLANANEPVDEWERQVNASFLSSNEQVKTLVLGYGFFLGGHYAEAEQIWNSILQKSGGADLRARAMLAATQRRRWGKIILTGPTQVEPFVPDFGDLYASVSFLEMRQDFGYGMP